MKRIHLLLCILILSVIFLNGCVFLPKYDYTDQSVSVYEETNNDTDIDIIKKEDTDFTMLQKKSVRAAAQSVLPLSAMWTARAPRLICAPILQAAKPERPIPT